MTGAPPYKVMCMPVKPSECMLNLIISVLDFVNLEECLKLSLCKFIVVTIILTIFVN